MKLEDVRILELLPAWMRRDGSVIGLAQGGSTIARDAYSRLRYLTRWDKIDQLSSTDLDELAWELNILWYNSTAPIETKRQLIKSSDLVFARLGTRWAVEQVTAAYFGNARLYEWFEYGGDPHFFKVQIDFDPTQEQKDEFRRILEIVKRKSQWLEFFVVRTLTEVYNPNNFRLVRLKIRGGVNNWFQSPVLFNGEVDFGGAIRWNQQIVARNSLELRIRSGVKTESGASVFFLVPSRFQESQRAVSSLSVRSRFLSGAQLRLVPVGMQSRASFQNPERGIVVPAVSFKFCEQNAANQKSISMYDFHNRNNAESSRIRLHSGQENGWGSAARVITNRSFTFDGQKIFDGSKKFNSGVTTEL